LKREIQEEVGIDLDLFTIKESDENLFSQFEEKKSTSNVSIEPLLAYESIYPETLDVDVPNSHIFLLYFLVKINEHKDNIKIKMQLEEVGAYAWMNFEDLNSLFNKREGEFEAFVERSGEFEKTILNHENLNSWNTDLKEGIPWGHKLAIDQMLINYINTNK